MTNIVIYTDGAVKNNQQSENYGGWGAVLIVYRDGEELYRKELYGGEKNTTNNKMELTAVIKGLSKIKDCYRNSVPVEVYADSNYVVQGVTSWIHGWKKRGWKKSDKKPVENKDLWVELDNLVQQFNDINFVKVKGHSGDTLNDKADELANKGAYEAMGESVEIESSPPKKYEITLNGCDDTTYIEMELTDEQLEFVKLLSKKSEENSSYS